MCKEDLASDELLNLVIPALKHRNRFVREAGFGCLTAFLPKENFEHGSGVPPVYDFGDRLAAAIADGMDDNWSQVRMAASVAARRFLCGLSAEQRQHYLPCLLPRVCLSRYYVAEGVKIYNQRTWETIAGQRGRELVEQYINDVVEYYLVATTAENHAVREAACYCITELLKKLPPQPLAPFAERVLDALLVCFQDDSWPVRDTACLAVGRLLVAFPETCRPHLDRLYPLLFSNLHDNIPSVRQGGAEALANAVRAYGEQALTLVMNRVREDLTALKDEPEPSGPAAAPGGYAERKQQRDNDEQLHTNQTMYSCGSLAPKMAAGGCSACHRFRRPVELWEAADGSARLLAELAAAPGCGGTVSETVPLLAAAAGRRHYTHHLQLLETVCRALPPLATGIGKRCFKTHLHLLLDTIMYSLTCESQLAAEAGRCCVQQLSGLLGPNIFRGRVENHNPRSGFHHRPRLPCVHCRPRPPSVAPGRLLIMEGSGAGADRPAGAGERDRRGVYLEDVAKEFDSWLFWRDEAGAAGPEPAQQPEFQVVTARRVHLAETARLAAPEAQRAPCRIPSPTDQLLAESRQRLRGSSSAAAAASAVSDSGIACGASTADEASDLEEDWSVQSGHEMGNKMGTATPERRKTRIMAIKDAGRKKRLGGSSSSSAEILDTVPPRTEQPAAPADRADVPERVARFPRPGPDSPVKAPPHQASAQPQAVPQQPQAQQPQSQQPQQPQPPAEATNSFVTDSWKQVRRLQEGCDAAAGVASDESSGSFTDPLSSSRAGARSGTSNTMRQDADPDTATLTDALVAAELPMDDTPVRRHDEPLHPDSIELSVDERLSVDLTRSCEPSMLQSLLSDATPVAEDRARSFSQADVNEGESPRPSTRPTFTVTKHRKVDLGGRLSQTAPGLEHTTSEHCLPVGPSCGREAGMQWLVVLTAALAVGGAQPPPAEPVYAGLTRDQVIVALKAAFATLSAEERAVPSVGQVAAGPEIGPDAGPGAAAAPPETASPVEQRGQEKVAATAPSEPVAEAQPPSGPPTEASSPSGPAIEETVPEAASSPEPPAEVPGGQSEPDPVPPTGADGTAPSRAPIVVPEEYYPSTFSHPFPPGFFSLYKIPNESEAPSAGSV
ncbi:hypothetical protein FJT64_016037 [Amphibalanus amphitrite]|uniref:Uncharacterized protein n=1 Tax=Amphibalanus amphitrite TaxID=1232801 RepID=A0A6A4XBP9_AMPAM|nr:hypothetical protein FJT64_016037 [Amphibalanus amphitrite]